MNPKIQNTMIGVHQKLELNLMSVLENRQSNCIQIFTKSPIKASKIIMEYEVNRVREYIQQHDIHLFVHSQYIINMCDDKDWAMRSLVDDMRFLHSIGGKGVVVHMGKNVKRLNYTDDEAYEAMNRNINNVLDKVGELTDVKLLLENSAGQGTEIGGHPEELSKFDERVNFCIDTAHLWGKGYEIQDYFGKLTIPNDRISLIHLNDSCVEKGSRKDRHAPLGMGLMNIQKDMEFIRGLDIDIVFETGGDFTHEKNMVLNS